MAKKIFYVLMLCLPLGTAKVFFTANSFYYGYHAFYNSTWIYLTDALICALILAWLWESRPLSFHRIRTVLAQDYLYLSLFIFWLILAISTIVSRETWLSVYGFIKISEFLVLFIYIRENLNVSREIKVIFWLILAISTLEATLGISQYLNQHSLGLKIFGESFISPGLNGVAEFKSESTYNSLISRLPAVVRLIGRTQEGETINIRSYGTFPHPNVFAAFLFLGFLANLWLIYGVSQKYNPPQSPLPLKVREGWEGLLNVSREILLGLSLLLISTAVVLTFTRTVWLALALGLLVLYISVKYIVGRKVMAQMRAGSRDTGAEHYHPRRLAWMLLILVFSFALNWFLFSQQIKDRVFAKGESDFGSQESIVNRGFYNSLALKMFHAHPITGVGLRNFVVRMDPALERSAFSTGQVNFMIDGKLLPYLHQPVHNIYLLLLAETGALGLAAFLFLLFNIVRHAIKGWKGESGGVKLILLTAFCGFLFLGFFDHYFFSIQQGGLMFWAVAGLLAAKS